MDTTEDDNFFDESNDDNMDDEEPLDYSLIYIGATWDYIINGES